MFYVVLVVKLSSFLLCKGLYCCVEETYNTIYKEIE